MQVGFNPVAAGVCQFRIVRPVIQEEILQIQATGIRLALIVVLHLGNLILGCHLEILILGLCHTEIAHLVGDLVGHLHNGHICQVILTPIHQGLVHTIRLRLQVTRLDETLEFGKQGITQDSLETNLLCLPEGGQDVFPGQVVGNTHGLLDELFR